MNHGLEERVGLIGQYGRLRATMAAVQAMAAARHNWLQPSQKRGRGVPRAATDPALLPIPNPSRNTDRMIENVYTVAPSISESRRVQITSAPSAVSPDKAMVT